MKPTIWRVQKPARLARNYPMLSLFEEMNRFFDEVSPGDSSSKGFTQFNPKLDVKETPTEFILTGEFAGMDEKEITIEVHENTLTLSGEKKFEHEHKEGERVWIERSFGTFSRTIPFEVEVDEDNARAEMKNGLLKITIPKSAKVVKGAKKLSIKMN